MRISSSPKAQVKVQVVSFQCTLKTNLGELISSSFNRDVRTDAIEGDSDRIPALADGLKNLRQGEKRRICVSAVDAYGLYNRELLIEVSRKTLSSPQRLVVGQQVVVEAENGEQRPFRVVGFTGKRVTLDGNHPLAGQDLVFDIEATEVREATAAELDREDRGSIVHPKWGLLH